MELLDKYFKLQKEIYDYFGYVEDWVVIPLDDSTEYFWFINETTGQIGFALDENDLKNQDGNYYENTIYTQRFLKKWVYRGKDFTMVCADTHCDGNKFLQVFDNKKERKEFESEEEVNNVSKLCSRTSQIGS